MNNYEMMCIFDPKTTSETETTEMVSQQLASFNAESVEKQDMGRKRLAYPIKKRTEGLYWLYNFKLDPQKVDGLKKALLIKESLIRFLLVKKEA